MNNNKRLNNTIRKEILTYAQFIVNNMNIYNNNNNYYYYYQFIFYINKHKYYYLLKRDYINSLLFKINNTYYNSDNMFTFELNGVININ